jgi:hypothetical protein
LAKTGDEQLPAEQDDDDELEDEAPVGVDDPALKAEARTAAFNPEADQARRQSAEVLDAAVLDAKLELDAERVKPLEQLAQNDATVETASGVPEDALRVEAALADLSSPETARDELVPELWVPPEGVGDREPNSELGLALEMQIERTTIQATRAVFDAVLEACSRAGVRCRRARGFRRSPRRGRWPTISMFCFWRSWPFGPSANWDFRSCCGSTPRPSTRA